MRTILVEPRAKPVAFLRRALRDLGVEYEVLAKRAEDVARSRFREAADHVVARAVAPPSVALELTLPLVAVGGNVLIPVGSLDEAGLSTAARAADELGGAEPVLSRLEVPGADGGRWVMIVQKARSTPERYPRRPGVPRRRPLGGAGVT